MYFARFLLDFQSVNRLLHLCGMPLSYKRVKWFNQTPDPPQNPAFHTLTKIHKPTLVGRPIISGCEMVQQNAYHPL